MKLGKIISTTLFASALLAMLSACQKPESPTERAAREMGEVVEKTGEKIEKAGENLQDAAKPNKP